MSLAHSIEKDSARIDRTVAAEIAEVIARHNAGKPKAIVDATGRLAARLAAAAAALPLARQKKLLTGKPRQDVDRMVDALLELSSEAPGERIFIPEPTEIERRKGSGFGELVSLEEGRRRLRDYATPTPIEEWAGPVAGPGALARDYGIRRSTLYTWQKRGAVIGLLKGERKHVFPIEQFVDGRPVAGLSKIVEIAPSPRAAWLWLVQHSPLLGGKRPIDVLKQDKLDEVVEAARTVYETL